METEYRVSAFNSGTEELTFYISAEDVTDIYALSFDIVSDLPIVDIECGSSYYRMNTNQQTDNSVSVAYIASPNDPFAISSGKKALFTLVVDTSSMDANASDYYYI